MQSISQDQPISAEAITAQVNKPVIQMGSTGEAVKEVQKLLRHWGHLQSDRAIDGKFDRQIDGALRSFQRRVFLVHDGIVGPLTWQALYTGAPVNMPVLKKGSKGQVVVTLQRVLQETNDYQNTIDGDFGNRTDAAVRAFQKRVGLVADGIVGKNTWYALSKVYQPTGY